MPGEIFIEVPNDLHIQSSTWSNYNHSNTGKFYNHSNTGKFLIGCTPNGIISFISDVYVGSMSDVELTTISGILEKLQGKPNIAVTADHGFTI